MRKPLTIDPDLWADCCAYVDRQIAVMSKFGDTPPDWNEHRRNEIAMEVAQYPQLLRNMRANPANP